MNVFKRIYLTCRMAKRIGLYKHGLKHGMSGVAARDYSDRMFPPTADDLAFEEAGRQKMLARENSN